MRSSSYSSLSRIRRAIVSAVVAAAIAGGCSADPVRKEIASVIAKGVKAVKNEDIDAYLDQIPDAILPPDSAAAAKARDNIRTGMRNLWDATTTRRITVTLDSLSAAADTAIVHTTMHWDRLVKGVAGSVDTIVSDLKHKELWKKTSKGWRSFKLLSLDGKNVTNGKEEIIKP